MLQGSSSTSQKKNIIKEEWRLVYAVGMGLFAVGLGRIINSDEVLLVFAAAATFDQVLNSEDRSVEEKGNEAVNRLFSYPIFALFGTAIPWEGWLSLGWAGVAAAILIMIFRRIPVLLILHPFLKVSHSLKDAFYMGWFGPVAVAALYYANLTQEKFHDSFIWIFVSLIIFTSVIIHGFTASPLTKLYGRYNRT
jgi:sodium/hydrogen antiporter